MTETESKWVGRLREWQDSGKRAEEFAAGKPYKASTLKWWRTQLQQRAAARDQTLERSKPIPMAQVVRRAPAADAAASGGVVVEISGARISIARGSDMELFAEVVRALGRAQ